MQNRRKFLPKVSVDKDSHKENAKESTCRSKL